MFVCPHMQTRLVHKYSTVFTATIKMHRFCRAKRQQGKGSRVSSDGPEPRPDSQHSTDPLLTFRHTDPAHGGAWHCCGARREGSTSGNLHHKASFPPNPHILSLTLRQPHRSTTFQFLTSFPSPGRCPLRQTFPHYTKPSGRPSPISSPFFFKFVAFLEDLKSFVSDVLWPESHGSCRRFPLTQEINRDRSSVVHGSDSSGSIWDYHSDPLVNPPQRQTFQTN